MLHSAIPRPPPETFRDEGGGYKDNSGSNTNGYRDDVDDDDDDDMDDEIVIDTTDHISRIRTASQRSFSSAGMNQNQNSSSGNMSVSSAADPPGSVYSDSGRYRDDDDEYNIGTQHSSSFEYDEADPVFVSSQKNKKKGRTSKGDLGGASDGIILSSEKSKSTSCCYRWFCCCCGSYARFCCFLLFVVLLAIAVTTAGVILAQKAKSSSEQSAAAAANGGTPAPSPVAPDPCPLELSNMDKCFADAEAENACETCVVQYWPTKVDACTDIDDETCTAFRECPCTPCIDAVDAYVHCLSGCKVECAAFGGGTLSPTITPAPTPSLMCPEQYQAFDDCVDPDKGGSDCENCVVASWPPPPAKLSCQEIADNTCPVLAQQDNCGCNNCNSQLLNVLVCLSNCTTLACGDGGTGTGTRRRTGSRGSVRNLAASKDYWHDRRSFAEFFLP
jgi:hypothetical protein